MKRICRFMVIALILMALTITAQAAESPADGSSIATIGVVVVMDDGIYVETEEGLFLLVDKEAPDFEGLTVEVIGEFLMIDDQPAINIQEIKILEDRAMDEAPLDSLQKDD